MPSAIKTGRYTHAKRTQDILEYRQVMGLSDDSSCASSAMASAISADAATATTVEATMTSSTATSVPFSSAAGMPGSSHCLNLASPPSTAASGIQPPSVETTCISVDSSSLSSEECENSSQYTTLSPVRLSVTSLHTPNSSSFAAPGSSGTAKSSVGVDVSAPSDVPHLSSPLSALSFVDNILDHMVGGESGRCDESLSLSSRDSNAPTPLSAVSSPECCTQSPTEKNNDDMSDEECRRLTALLLQSHDKVLTSKYEFTAEEMLEKQKTCFVSTCIKLCIYLYIATRLWYV